MEEQQVEYPNDKCKTCLYWIDEDPGYTNNYCGILRCIYATEPLKESE